VQSLTTGYHARDGTEHRVSARRTPESRWQVLDTAGDITTVVETLTGTDDGRDQARALGADYAAQQQAYADGDREDDPLPRRRPDAVGVPACAA
jgi:hypothetical protein